MFLLFCAILDNTANLTMTKCHFNESIPTEFGNLSNLQYIGMPDNKFSGTIPTEIGQLTALGKFTWWLETIMHFIISMRALFVLSS